MNREGEREKKEREGVGKEQSTNKSRGIRALVYMYIRGDGPGAHGPGTKLLTLLNIYGYCL